MNQAEESLLLYKELSHLQDKRRITLQNKIKLETHGVSFNGSSPRFRDQGRLYTVAGSNNCPILGPNNLGHTSLISNLEDGSLSVSKTVDYKRNLGPGSYDNFEQRDKSRNTNGTSPFRAPERSKKSFLSDIIS